MTIPTFLQRLFSYPNARVLAISLPIIACIGLVRLWAGYEQSVLFGIVTGVAVVLATDFLLADKATRSKKITHATALLRGPLRGVISAGCYVAAASYLYANTSRPAEAVVQRLTDYLVSNIWVIFSVLIFYWVAKATMSIFVRRCPNVSIEDQLVVAVVSLVLTGARAAFASCAALWLIGALGDEQYRLILADPQGAVLSAIAFVIALLLVRFSLSSGRYVNVAAVRKTDMAHGCAEVPGSRVESMREASQQDTDRK